MSGPSAPIDSDLVEGSMNEYYVLESGAIWKTSDLSAAGAATWTQVWGSGSFTGVEFGGLSRVRCAPGSTSLVYALGYGIETGSDYKAFVLRSTDAGGTWTQHWTADALNSRGYTVTQYAWGGSTSGAMIEWTRVIERVGDDIEGQTINPLALAHIEIPGINSLQIRPCTGGSGTTVYVTGNTKGDDVSIPVSHINSLIAVPDRPTVAGYLDDYFGAGGHSTGWLWEMPLDEGRVQLIDQMWGTNSTTFFVWLFWNVPSVVYPKAFDVARGNGNWLYIGMNDKILFSGDGGYNWSTLTSDHGATDICVDPQAAGAIYYWDTTGSLRLRVAGVDQGALDTEGAKVEIPLRIARDINSGKLWALNAGSTLKMRENGAWSTKKSYLGSARGLHTYLGGKMIFVDATKIYISDDYGTTVTDKTGGWSTFSGGLNSHRMT